MSKTQMVLCVLGNAVLFGILILVFLLA